MKKFSFILMAAAAAMLASCDIATLGEGSKNGLSTVGVQLTADGAKVAKADVKVTAKSGDTTFEAVTDKDGKATFTLPAGLYEATTSFSVATEGSKVLNYNGTASFKAAEATNNKVFDIDLQSSVSSQLIIKEVYVGGCMDNDNAKNYQYDKYMILYNNSAEPFDASKIGIAMVGPISSSGANKYYDAASGKYSFEEGAWIPAFYSMWWFKDGKKVVIEPYSQIVIAITGAIDHTKTYKNSVDLSNADFCMYAPETSFKLAAAYPAPAFEDASRYMTTVVYGAGTAWPIHMNQPGLILFMQGDKSAKEMSEDTANLDHTCGTAAANNAVKLPMSSVLDVTDVWAAANVATSTPRYPASINTGYVAYTTKAGYTIYRNVDKEATEAIAENAGKLVYGYALGTDGDAGSTDPSGIDAEASIANGAHIIYSDTNNMAKDFHQRKVASIKK